jgi:hypothetical protein
VLQTRRSYRSEDINDAKNLSEVPDAGAEFSKNIFDSIVDPAPGRADLTRAEHSAISNTFTRSIAKSVAKRIARYSSPVTNAIAGRTEFSPVGSRHGFQWTAIRQRSRDRANSGRRDVVWDRQRTRAF